MTAAGCEYQPVVVGDRKPRDLPQFLWVKTVLGKLKTTLAAAYHSLKYRKYAVDVAQCAQTKESVVRQDAEAGF